MFFNVALWEVPYHFLHDVLEECLCKIVYLSVKKRNLSYYCEPFILFQVDTADSFLVCCDVL